MMYFAFSTESTLFQEGVAELNFSLFVRLFDKTSSRITVFFVFRKSLIIEQYPQPQ